LLYRLLYHLLIGYFVRLLKRRHFVGCSIALLCPDDAALSVALSLAWLPSPEKKPASSSDRVERGGHSSEKFVQWMSYNTVPIDEKINLTTLSKK
jgi:hypothetical protein